MARITITSIHLALQMMVVWLINGILAQDATTDVNFMTTPPKSGSSTKGYDGPGPDELVTVDYIIIGVTCALVGGTLIGGIVFICKKSQASKREKKELYEEYLEKTQYAGLKPGHTNKGFLEGGAHN